MKRFRCVCGNALFYENSQCLDCGQEVGWCPACQAIQTLLPIEPAGESASDAPNEADHDTMRARGQNPARGETDEGQTGTSGPTADVPNSVPPPGDDGGLTVYRCGNSACGQRLVKCHNYAFEQVCNRCLCEGTARAPRLAELLCDCCRYNDTIPDLSVPGNRERWYRLEIAKRRLFYELNLLGLPYGKAEDGFSPPLAFDFKGDVIPAAGMWRSMGVQERVYTGHADGKITINIREADDVAREKLRVDMKESHRTLIGHFRHEIAHYYWTILVQDSCEDNFRQMFGDDRNPSYADAMEAYYQSGPPADWDQRFVSAYASMHPWEDFAETFATYLDMVGVLDTARHNGFQVPEVTSNEFDNLLSHYQRLGLVMNEMNRSMGLLDLVPEVFVPPVREKLRYVHEVTRVAQKRSQEMATACRAT